MLRYEKPLLQYSFSIIRDVERAQDVVQETFMRMYKQEQEAIEDHLSAWLFTVCRNCSLKALKKQERYVPLDPVELETHSSDEPSPSTALETSEALDCMMGHVEGLAPNSLRVVKLRYWENMSYQEISETTGLSVGNVGFILSTTTQHLRTLMNSSDKAEEFLTLRCR